MAVRVAALALAGCVIAFALVGHVAATGVTVTLGDDSSNLACQTSSTAPCSLRDAVIYANAHPNTTINFDPTVTMITLSTHTTLPLTQTTGTTTITGPGASALTVSGDDATPSFTVSSNVTAAISGLTITFGYTPGNGGNLNNSGALTLTNCVLDLATASGSGGNIANQTGATLAMNGGSLLAGGAINGGGLYNQGTATLDNVTVGSTSIAQQNSASGQGGGIYSSGTLTLQDHTTVLGNGASGGGGVSIFDNTTATITDSTIGGTTAGSGNTTTGNTSGGGILNRGTLTMTNSTVAGNTAGSGSGSTANGGGIENESNGTATSGILHLTNSTVSGNTTITGGYGYGGGINNNAGGTAGGRVTLDGGTMIGGTTAPAGNTAYYGGGIWSAGGVAILTITNSTVQYNTAKGGTSSDGGGIGTVSGTLNLTGSTVSNNTGHHGGGLGLDGAATITTSTISNNSAAFPGSFGEGGGILVNGNTTISGSTINGNTATGATGYGGGLFLNSGPFTATNTTISGNTALSAGGAIYNQGVGGTFTHVTIAGTGTGIHFPNALTLKDSILANSGGNCTGGGTPTDGHYNLISNSSCGLSDSTDLIGVDPALGTLAINAPGTTATQALLSGSPAIDRIPVVSGSCNNTGVTTDQRGTTRPQPTGGICDIGAYEYVPVTPTLSSATAGTAGGIVIVTGTGFERDSTLTVNGTPVTISAVISNGTSVTATVPAHAAGSVPVVMTNPDGSAATGTLTYVEPNPQPLPQPTALPVGGSPTAIPAPRPTGVPVTVATPNPLPGRRP